MPGAMDDAGDLLKAGRFAEAVALLEAILEREPGNADAWAALGEARGRRFDSPGALAAYEKAVELAPNDLGKLASLAWGHLYHGSLAVARDRFRRLAPAPGAERLKPDWLIGFALAEGWLGGAEAALAILLRAAQASPALAKRAWRQAAALAEPGHPLAGEILALARAADPSPEFLAASLLQTPPVFLSARRAETKWRSLPEDLAWLEKQNLRLRNPREVGWDRLFATLLFSDCNTLPIFRQHSEFLQNACPELLRTEVKIPSRLFIPRPRRLRLGVALNRCSDGLTSSAVSRLFRQLDRDRFETVLFFPDNSPANESFASMLAAVDESHAVPSALDREEWRETNLVAARAGLDLLLHENWGIYSFISFSRLAPVQCSFFDTCISIAAPAEDYVVLAGKPDWLADWKSWYAEKIVLLDNFVGGWGKPGPDEPEAVHLEEFGLPSTAKLMFTWHDPRRWDPGDDALLAKLLSDNPAAWLLVAASHHPPTVRQGLAIRWRLSLAAAYERIKFIPFQPPGRFLGLLRRADLVLTPPVAGTMSTGTALGQGVSLVVRDGQSPNIKINTLAYEILGVEGLIARSPEEWLALNQRLLDDRDWRRKKGEEIRANYPKLHDQAAAVRDLENFLEAAYERARNGLPPAAWSGGRFLDG